MKPRQILKIHAFRRLFLSIRRSSYSLSPKSDKKALPSAALLPPKCVSGGVCNTRKGTAKLTAPCLVTCLLFPFLSFRLFRFTLSLPFPELLLAFCAFIVGENIREDAPGDVFDFVLRDTGIVDELFLAAQAGCSLRFDIKIFRCSYAWVDDLYLRQGSFLKTENAGARQAAA